MKIAEVKEFVGRLEDGKVSADEVRATWNRFKETRDELKAELAALKKEELKPLVGWHYQSTTKARMVDAAYENSTQVFVAGGALTFGLVTSGGLSSREAAIDAQMGKWTDDLIQRSAEARRAKIAEKAKAITNPETLEEFDRYVRFHGTRGFASQQEVDDVRAMPTAEREEFIQRRGEGKLSPEQLVKYDELRAAAGRQVRDRQAAAKLEVGPTQVAEGLALKIVETTHTKLGHKLWVVQLSDRVDRDKYDELNERAKALGGYYSSYRGNGAIPGFTFKTVEAAEKFKSLEQVDGGKTFTQILEEKQARAAERLENTGERMVERGTEVLEADRKTNTVRRATMANAIEGRAREEIRTGETVAAVADAVREGSVRFIDRIQSAVQVETIDKVLSDARYARIKDEIRSGKLDNSGSTYERELDKPFSEEDIKHARFPWPVVHSSLLLNAVNNGMHTAGAKLAAVRVRNHILQPEHPATEIFTLRDSYRVEIVRDLADRVGNRFLRDAIAPHDRLQRMSITNDAEVRAALREYLPLREEKLKADPVKLAERELVGTKIPGFFPTPPGLARELVDRAELEPGMRVLEPSVGKGDLYEEIQRREPTARIDTVEVSSTLHDLLTQKGIPLTFKGSFLSYNPGQIYDRIVMNPPFEDGADALHVKHAFSLLKPGGKLVAIMSEGPFHREDHQSRQFREWAEREGGESERNPDGSFAGADAFRQTGVSTRIFTVEKTSHRMNTAVTHHEAMHMAENVRSGVKVAI